MTLTTDLATGPLDAGRLETLVRALRTVLADDQILTSKPDRYNRARVPAPFPVHRWSERLPDLGAADVHRAGGGRRADRQRAEGAGRPAGRRHRADRRRGALRGGIVVDVKRMNQIHEIDLVNRTVTVGTGINMLKLNERLARHGLFYPDDPGVLPLLAGGRADRDQRLVADRLALRAHPRPGAQLRPRAAHRRGDARRRRQRRQDQQVLQRLSAQAPVHGPPGHARHRHEGDAQALPGPEAELSPFWAFDNYDDAYACVGALASRGGHVRRWSCSTSTRSPTCVATTRRAILQPNDVRALVCSAMYGYEDEVRAGGRRLFLDRRGARRALPRGRDLRGRLGRAADRYATRCTGGPRRAR